MKYFSANKYKGQFQPDYVASSPLDIDYKYLAQIGIKCVAFDADGTVVKNKSLTIDSKFARKLEKSLNAAGLKAFIATNSTRDLSDLQNKLKAVIHAPTSVKGKPSKEYYEGLLKHMKCKPHEATMVGDRLIQDVWGAKKAGLLTVMIELNPDFTTFRDKVIARHYWHSKRLRKKISKPKK